VPWPAGTLNRKVTYARVSGERPSRSSRERPKFVLGLADVTKESATAVNVRVVVAARPRSDGAARTHTASAAEIETRSLALARMGAGIASPDFSWAGEAPLSGFWGPNHEPHQVESTAV
jgi:hypothetical protein